MGHPVDNNAALYSTVCYTREHGILFTLFFRCAFIRSGVKKKVVLLGGAHHKVAYPPPPSCGQSTTFLWEIFYLLRIP